MQQVAGVPHPPAQPTFSVPGPPTCLKECSFKKGHRPPQPPASKDIRLADWASEMAAKAFGNTSLRLLCSNPCWQNLADANRGARGGQWAARPHCPEATHLSPWDLQITDTWQGGAEWQPTLNELSGGGSHFSRLPYRGEGKQERNH